MPPQEPPSHPPMAQEKEKPMPPTEPPQPPMEPIPQEPMDLSLYTKLFKVMLDKIRNLKTKEASGYGVLTCYLLFISERMQQLYGLDVKIDVQFPIKGDGKTFFADGAVIQIIVNMNYKSSALPIYVIEYKPRVPSKIEDIEPFHLSELFLQANYLGLECTHPILHVLTDLADFHCFEIKNKRLVKYHISLFATTSWEPDKVLCIEGNTVTDYRIASEANICYHLTKLTSSPQSPSP